MPQQTFGTAINCVDGRVQRPVVAWMRETHKLDWVDVVTEPGADRVLARWQIDKMLAIKERLRVSVERHGSRVIAVAGHHDCAASPGSADLHREQIGQAVAVVRSWNFGAQVIGLWVNEKWEVEVVVDDG